MKINLTVLWGYTVELIAALLMMALLWIFIDYSSLANFMKATASDFVALGVVMLAFSTAFLLSMHAKAETKFYKWLGNKGALDVYQNTTGFCVGLSIVLIFALIIVKETEVVWFQIFVVFLLIYSAINMVTLTVNIIQFMRLNGLFNSKLDDE